MSLFLILLLHLPALTGQRRHVRVAHGETAILPCEYVMNFQYRCENTDWFFGGPESRARVALVRGGQVAVNATDRSYRLGGREPCSLIIPVVTFDDIGDYFCRQIRPGFGIVQDSVVNLEVFIPDRVHPDPDFTHVNSNGEVTTPAATKITTTAASTITDAPTEQARTDCSAVNYIVLVLRVAELVLITVITVFLIRAPGNQRPPDDDTVHQDEGTVNYENIGGPSASVKINT